LISSATLAAFGGFFVVAVFLVVPLTVLDLLPITRDPAAATVRLEVLVDAIGFVLDATTRFVVAVLVVTIVPLVLDDFVAVFLAANEDDEVAERTLEVVLERALLDAVAPDAVVAGLVDFLTPPLPEAVTPVREVVEVLVVLVVDDNPEVRAARVVLTLLVLAVLLRTDALAVLAARVDDAVPVVLRGFTALAALLVAGRVRVVLVVVALLVAV
jgi:hypothetical protein